MRYLKMALVALGFAVAAPVVVVPVARAANISQAQAQAAFNQAVHDDAGEGITWWDCGSLHPFISHTSQGWVASGDYVYRGRPGACGLNTQVCYWSGRLGNTGLWLDRRKSGCR